MPTEVVRAKIREYLDAAEWSYSEHEGSFVVPLGSATVWVSALDVEEFTLVHFRSLVVTDVEQSEVLYRYVATQQPPVFQLSVVYDDTNDETDVHLTYALHEASLAPEAFEHILGMFAFKADELDDQLRTLFGGRRSSDL